MNLVAIRETAVWTSESWSVASKAVSAWNIPSALESYEVKRMPRTARVQMACREEGEVLHAMTSAGKDEPIGIERFLPQRLPGFTRDWLYEYDATAS